MAKLQSDYYRNIKQAVRQIRFRNPIPTTNFLLFSPLTSEYLLSLGLEDSPDNRQLALEAALRDLVNEYIEKGAGKPENPKDQSRIADLLFNMLRGQDSKLFHSDRSIEAYRPRGFEILAEKFKQREDLLLRMKEGKSGFYQNMKEAQELAEELEENRIDFFVLSRLYEVAIQIENDDYPEEAKKSFELMWNILNQSTKKPNKIFRIGWQEKVASHLAQCLMNLDETQKAAQFFQQAAEFAQDLEDWEEWLHNIHMLGVSYRMIGNWNLALYNFNLVLENAHKGSSSVPYRRAHVQRDMISAYIDKKDFLSIPDLARKSLVTKERLGEFQAEMTTFEIWGKALIAEKKYPEAEQKLNEALALLPYVNSMIFQAILFTTRAHLYYAWGKQDEGRENERRAREIAEPRFLFHEIKRLNHISQFYS